MPHTSRLRFYSQLCSKLSPVTIERLEDKWPCCLEQATRLIYACTVSSIPNLCPLAVERQNNTRAHYTTHNHDIATDDSCHSPKQCYIGMSYSRRPFGFLSVLQTHTNGFEITHISRIPIESCSTSCQPLLKRLE